MKTKKQIFGNRRCALEYPTEPRKRGELIKIRGVSASKLVRTKPV